MKIKNIDRTKVIKNAIMCEDWRNVRLAEMEVEEDLGKHLDRQNGLVVLRSAFCRLERFEFEDSESISRGMKNCEMIIVLMSIIWRR